MLNHHSINNLNSTLTSLLSFYLTLKFEHFNTLESLTLLSFCRVVTFRKLLESSWNVRNQLYYHVEFLIENYI